MPGARPPPARCGVNPGVGLPLQAGRVHPDRCVSWPLGSGLPTLAEAHIEGYYAIDPALFRPRADDLLRVRGLSLREAGILEGDWLAVHRTTEVRSGQLVVVRYPAASWRQSAPCGQARPGRWALQCGAGLAGGGERDPVGELPGHGSPGAVLGLVSSRTGDADRRIPLDPVNATPPGLTRLKVARESSCVGSEAPGPAPAGARSWPPPGSARSYPGQPGGIVIGHRSSPLVRTAAASAFGLSVEGERGYCALYPPPPPAAVFLSAAIPSIFPAPSQRHVPAGPAGRLSATSRPYPISPRPDFPGGRPLHSTCRFAVVPLLSGRSGKTIRVRVDRVFPAGGPPC